MATLSPKQLYNLARDAGLSPGASLVAAAVALGESGGRTDAVGDAGIQTDKWGPSVGLWQIRSLKADYGTGRARDASRLTDPAFNAKSMAEISGTGQTFQPWSVYTSGKYKQYIDAVHNDNTAGLGDIPEVIDEASDAVGKAVDAFAGWQSDLQGVFLKLGVTMAAVWLVVAGVKSAAGGDDS